MQSVAHTSRKSTLVRRALLAIAAVSVSALLPEAASPQALDPEALRDHVRYLASDALAGREAGEPGADSAAAYIARQFEGHGLEPLGDQGYYQTFQVTSTVEIGPQSRLTLRSSMGARYLELHREWLPFNFSGGGEVTGPAVRVGHGLRETDFQALEAAEQPAVVVMKGGLPEDFDPHGAGVDPSVRRRATTAREQGAAAVLVTVSAIDVPRAGDPPHAIGLPVVQVLETDDILAWLGDADLTIHLDARVEPVRAEAYNVVGRIPGRDPVLAEQIVVVGAHYDHLGMGGPGSLAPDSVTPHNGADDNASGTALLLGLAQYFALHPDARPARSLVFVAFSAEEMGLLGSEHFVSHPPFPLERVSAMVNFDMVGRLRDERLQVFGTETAAEFPALLDSLDAASPLELSRIGDGYGPSDQTSFYARDIPVLHLFTGTHSEYHHPDDDWELINAEGMAEIGDLAVGLLRDLGNRRDGLELVRQERPQQEGGGGYGPYLGTVPDFGEVEGGGLRLSGVRAGSPAERAGLQAGDVVIEFGGKEVLNIYDYTYALREHAPGDRVMIKVRRDGEILELEAELGQRR